MAKGKRKPKTVNAFGVIIDFAEAVDTIFQRLTGKRIPDWLKEFQQPRELPPGAQATPTQPTMPLADAYAILGLKPDASMEDVKRNYRNLARAFHSDSGNVMNDEAMKLLNKAHSRILKQRGGS